MMKLPLLLVMIAPTFAAEESRFALWTPAAIQQREQVLMKSVAHVSSWFAEHEAMPAVHAIERADGEDYAVRHRA